MSLTPNFELSPVKSSFWGSLYNRAHISCIGPAFASFPTSRACFNLQYSHDELYFHRTYAADPILDFTDWITRVRNPHIQLWYDLSDFGNYKELALIFGFDPSSKSRILVYSDAGQLADIPLEEGDNQFLLEVEAVDYMHLYFIHARHDGSNYGGNWYFRGITGYVI